MYFSCKAHLDELISSLEDDGKEKRLLSALKAKYKTMVKHMEITEALTEAARGRTVNERFIYSQIPGLPFLWKGCGAYKLREGMLFQTKKGYGTWNILGRGFNKIFNI